MSIIRIIVLFTGLGLLSHGSLAQQEFMLTHYMFNGLAINPAYAGVHDGISTSFLWREQWTGFNGAPSTQVASIHSPIPDKSISLGAIFYRDQLGLSHEYGTLLSYAYRMGIMGDLQLSLGLRVSTHHYKLDYEVLNQNINDFEGFNSTSQSLWNMGTGLLLHTNRGYLGLSLPQMLNQKLNIEDPDGRYVHRIRHYYLTAGYAFDLGRDLVLKPNFLLKGVDGAPWQLDINMNVLIGSKILTGISYRTLDSLDALIGVQINPNMSVSYATDFTLTAVASHSHEVMMNFIFNLPTQKILTPRYF